MMRLCLEAYFVNAKFKLNCFSTARGLGDGVIEGGEGEGGGYASISASAVVKHIKRGG
jgi:hypothetical protein